MVKDFDKFIVPPGNPRLHSAITEFISELNRIDLEEQIEVLQEVIIFLGKQYYAEQIDAEGRALEAKRNSERIGSLFDKILPQKYYQTSPDGQ